MTEPSKLINSTKTPYLPLVYSCLSISSTFSAFEAAGFGMYPHGYDGNWDMRLEAGRKANYGIGDWGGVQGFLSVDPLTSSYPTLTPYQFASNSPIGNIDLDGLESYPSIFASPGDAEPVIVQATDNTVVWSMHSANAPSVDINGPRFSTYERSTIVADKVGQGLYNLAEAVLSIPNAVANDHAAGNARLLGNNKIADELAAKSKEGYVMGGFDLITGYGISRFVRASSYASRTIVGTNKLSVTDKLSDYLLNKFHPVGGSKAKWFDEALGFNVNNADDLAKQLVFDIDQATLTAATEFGTKYNQTIPIKGANGNEIDVVFGWIIKKGEDTARLVTGIPTKQ